MPDQADRLRQLVRDTVEQHPALEPGVPLVVISGGKGGVGTSTVAMELAQELGSLGKRSVLVDANPLQPDIATRLGIDIRGCLADVLDGSRSAVEVLEAVGESIQLLPGRWAATTPPEMSGSSVRRLLNQLRSMHSQADFVVVDAGSGMSPWTGHLWKAAQQILLVSTNESVAVMDSYAAVKLSPWGDVDGKIRLVVNRCDSTNSANAIGERFAATCRRFLGIRVTPAVGLATLPDILCSVTASYDATAEQDFRRTLRLLAAEVVSTSLSIHGTVSQQRSGAALSRMPSLLTNKSLQNSNSVQS